MKTLFLAFLLAACFFTLSHAEIEARFPGVQPILVNGAVDNTPTGIEDKRVIDAFTFDTVPPLTILIPDGGAPPVLTATTFDVDSSILGGERDIILTASQGVAGLLFSAGASGETFNLATSVDSVGVVTLQYDGVDRSADLHTSPGLGGIDLTADGAFGFRVFGRTDVDTQFSIRVVDQDGVASTLTSSAAGGSESQSYYLTFDAFGLSVDFTRVASIELTIQALENVDFVVESFVTYGDIEVVQIEDCITGVILPCDVDYYRLVTFSDVQIGDYLAISFAQSPSDASVAAAGKFYIISSAYEDLQEELASNENIKDTFGELPGPLNYEYACSDDCRVEIVAPQLKNLTYYLAVSGGGDGNLAYQICLNYRSVTIFNLVDGLPKTVFLDQRPTTPPDDSILKYRFYTIDVPHENYVEGTFLVVNISRAEPLPGVGLKLMYGALPELAVDTGVLGTDEVATSGVDVDHAIYDYCVDMTDPSRILYDRPISADPRVSCSCFTEVLLFGNGPSFQLTCQLVVDPCQFRYGRWYLSVELPERQQPSNPLDQTGNANYTIVATTIQPSITEMIRNVTFKAFVEREAYSHFRLNVTANTVNVGKSHLFIHLSNVRNGFVDLFVHRASANEGANLAGGIESCVPANATCHTSDACNVIIEKCHFVPGIWYISVAISYDNVNKKYMVNDIDRLPLTFTLRANWIEDAAPKRLVAGVPTASFIGEALYDFYVITVPPTIDTWLFVELYAKANDTEVILSILNGELPGGDCYARPDYYCMTGDPTDARFNSGSPAFLSNDPAQRESCSFMIQTCELTAGSLYISVYGHHKGYTQYGDHTFYQVPVQYTLWADFDSALAISSGVSYSETVFEKQYQHYYIRADQVAQGSSLSVEITNIQHGAPQTIEAFVNYNYLAGNCPCYDHLYNCTGAVPCGSSASLDVVQDCCTIVVPASDFRPGVWYIAVLGVHEDMFSYTTPIGYTLTATVQDAPEFKPLLLGQIYQGEVPEWNTTLQYANFRLGAVPVPLADLVFKVTFVQNCDFMGKHNDKADSLTLFVNNGAPATQYLGGYRYKCIADGLSQSFCTIVVPHCEWVGNDWFVAVQGNYAAQFTGRFSLRAFVDEVRDYQLVSGVSHYDRVSEYRYKHFFIDVVAQEDEYYSIDLYTNNDQDSVTVYLNREERAGALPCFVHSDVCTASSYCTWQLHACDIESGRYYVSVYGNPGQFYDTSVEFTLTVTKNAVSTQLFDSDPFTGHLKQVGDVQHYRFAVSDSFRAGSFLSFQIDNVQHGAVTAYVQHGFLAGRCPCFVYEQSCNAQTLVVGDSDAVGWCEIRVPSCELESGDYFLSIWAVEAQTPAAAIFLTPIGYTLEVNLITPIITEPFVALGRDLSNTEPFQFLANRRYNHYRFTVGKEDFSNGYHFILEITSVRDGALFVYYNQLVPGGEESGCHVSKLCTSGLGSGQECYWQLPYCMARPLATNQYHYITVEAIASLVQASYNLLIYKQDAPSIISNPAFTLDNGVPTTPVGAVVSVLHNKIHEPTGWTQFIRLSDVPARLDEGKGEMLELFFYKVTNNPGQSMSFNVYLHPNKPAGAHTCCGTDPAVIGACQGAPCSHTVDTTVSVDGGADVVSHTCSFASNGAGSDGNGNALFGSRCIVRVWPCEFNKYCAANTTDWFVSVVPTSATAPSSSGSGLQYSVQWRVRDIRRLESAAIGSLSLNSAINTYEYTNSYSVTTPTTEAPAALSFFVDYVARNSTRLSIQTRFASGSGLVTIRGGQFASHTCNLYECSTNCDSTGRFVVSECRADAFERYYITVQNTGSANSQLSVQFRIVEIDFPETITIDVRPSLEVPFVASSTESVHTGVVGVEGENYDYYSLTVDDDDLDQFQTWVIDVNRPSGDVGALSVFVRFGAAGGLVDSVEGCHGFQYSCASLLAGGRCLLQIPSCRLTTGHWYISIFNPAFDFASVPSSLPRYTLSTYISHAPTAVSLGVSVSSPSSFDHAIIQHYSFTVQPEDIFDNGVAIDDFVTRFLRVQLDDVVGSNTFYVAYGSLAGLPSSLDCYQFAKTATCNGASCFVDFLPCLSGDAGLKTGTYFVAVSASGSYSLSAHILTDDYAAIPLTETIVGSGNRLGVTDHLYSYTPSQTELNGRGDGSDNYRYVFEIASDAEDNSLPDNEYLIFNFTSPNGAQNGAVTRFEVFRDSCTRYSCETIGPNSWCAVDAIEMAPCTSFGGLLYVRVENPSVVQFTVNLYHNQTVIQKLENHQTLTEIIFPYEYQEYLFNAESLGDASVFSVSICAICGEVEAFIRANGPAGPDAPGSNGVCSIDSCSASGSMDTTFDPENNCCTLFLDTCQYKESDYYIGVRGVTTDFPNVRNPHIYLPAKYEINVEQTNLNVTDINFSSCPKVIEVSHSFDDPPAQYAIDIESLQVGSQVKFSIRLPSALVVAVPATLKVQLNHSLGYSDGCPLGSDEVFSCSSLTSCAFVVPYCKFGSFGGGVRFYILADAPRGSEIIVERHDPSIPILTNDVTYSGSINHGVLAATNFYLPWTPNRQIYRFDLAPHSFDDEDDSDFFEKFYVQVQVSNVQHGTVSAIVNAGNSPFLPNTGCVGAGFLFVDTTSCSAVDDFCFVEIHYSTLRNLYGGSERYIPKTFWLTIIGDQQTCELHTIKYDLIVKTNWVITYFPVNESVCNSVEQGSTNFHRLRPKSVETPQESILRIHIEDLDVGEEVLLMVQDKHLATAADTVPFKASSTGSTEIDVDYICGYSDLYLSVSGTKSIDSAAVDYRMTVEKTPVRVKDLFNNQVYHADDDDDDACPHKHDFYRFKTAPLNGHHSGSFLRVLVDSDFDTKVYVNKNSFAWEGCADSGTGSNSPATSGTTSVNVYDFCDFDDGSYFITVVAEGPYKIFTHVRDDAKNITLGEVYRDQLEAGSYQMYILDICKDWMQPDDRLVVEIADVQNSDVHGAIRLNSNAGSSCALDQATSLFGSSSSGFNFLLVDSCELTHGHYYILIHALPLPLGSTNAEDVSFRLFPYLVDYDIEPKEIFPNLAITDSVDLHRFDRIAQDSLPFTQYYQIAPLKDGRGYYEQVSQAVVRLFDVSGGLLQLRVMRDHLAVPYNDYIAGETNGLIRPAASATEFNMRYGQYPLIQTRILGDRTSVFQEGCDGCSDFCGTMTSDDLDRYSTDSSIAVWVPSCYMVWSDFFVAVTAGEQDSPLVPISYSLEFEQTRDFILLQTDHHHVQSFADDNWDYDFYYSISAEPSSMRWRVVVTEGEGVLVTVRNHRCPLQSTWSKEIWCDAAYFDRPWLCDIEIPTRAAHPGDNAYFVSVFGKNATYSIAFWRGRENCHSFTGSGRNEGLDFCAGLVPFGTWRWDNYANLDKESKCFFEQLYSHFHVQPCYTGVTPECNATLQAFACYESFKRCDEQGFSTGTCRGQCDLVAYECANNFETVDLEHYDCSSSRYIDSHAGTCTGSSEYDFAEDAFFLGDAVDLLFKSSPTESESAASLSLLSGWVFLASLLLSLI